MDKAEINQLVVNNLRNQRIEADDRTLNALVNLDIANKRIEELEKELKELQEPKGT